MRAFAAFLLGLVMATGVQAQAPIRVYAAGSLREALTAVGPLWQERGGAAPSFTFGASGLLRERIEQGEPVGVFASADIEHPQRLAQGGRWQAPVVFTRNALCALAGPQVQATPQTLLATLLRNDVRLGTSTPLADPSGDYAWAMFRRAEAVQGGAQAALEAKALQLTGKAGSPQPPAGRGTYAWIVDSGQADIFLTYCTNAVASQREVPRLQVGLWRRWHGVGRAGALPEDLRWTQSRPARLNSLRV
jgi:ABC-type molybdate transport system substrate-binding protein